MMVRSVSSRIEIEIRAASSGTARMFRTPVGDFIEVIELLLILKSLEEFFLILFLFFAAVGFGSNYGNASLQRITGF